MLTETEPIHNPGLGGPSPADINRMLSVIYGRFAGQVVCLAAKLGIADQIAAGVKTTEALASRLNANPDSLRRLLLALAAHGILFEDTLNSWELTSCGELLRGGVPG